MRSQQGLIRKHATSLSLIVRLLDAVACIVAGALTYFLRPRRTALVKPLAELNDRIVTKKDDCDTSRTVCTDESRLFWMMARQARCANFGVYHYMCCIDIPHSAEIHLGENVRSIEIKRRGRL